MKALQIFSDEYLEVCKKISTEEIAQFLDDFRQIHGEALPEKSKLISVKMPPSLLNAFKNSMQTRGKSIPNKNKKANG